MDFYTLNKNIKSYTTVAQVYKDVCLIWSNCMEFNAEGSDIYNTAKKFATKSKSLFAARFGKDLAGEITNGYACLPA